MCPRQRRRPRSSRPRGGTSSSWRARRCSRPARPPSTCLKRDFSSRAAARRRRVGLAAPLDAGGRWPYFRRALEAAGWDTATPLLDDAARACGGVDVVFSMQALRSLASFPGRLCSLTERGSGLLSFRRRGGRGDIRREVVRFRARKHAPKRLGPCCWWGRPIETSGEFRGPMLLQNLQLSITSSY